MLAPEIHLTPQLQLALQRRFPDKRVVAMHSAMTPRARAESWLAARNGLADVVLGTRTAVFVPVPNLKIIVVDEEHDESFREAEQGLLFSARDLAAWRAKREGAAFVAGSATPSLESFHNAARGKYKLIRMRKTALAAARVSAELVSEDNLRDGMTPAFVGALRESLAADGGRGQALVFINRRGYAPALVCRGCRTAVECRRCANRMTAHRRRSGTAGSETELQCHWCGARSRLPERCGECGGDSFSPAGHGTQRVEEALGRMFPGAGAARLDRDSLSRRGAFAALREEIESGRRRILVGTQIIAKGHNFPRLNFIGILNADAGLLSSDFRAQERLFALLTQALGRGTRNPSGCRALIQTRHPEHPFYAELRRGDPEACWRRLLEERQRAGLPPYSHLALLRGKSRDAGKLRGFLERAKRVAPEVGTGGKGGGEVFVYDPVPDAASRVAGWHRAHIAAQSGSRGALGKFLREWVAAVEKERPGGGVRWTVEVDPGGI